MRTAGCVLWSSVLISTCSLGNPKTPEPSDTSTSHLAHQRMQRAKQTKTRLAHGCFKWLKHFCVSAMLKPKMFKLPGLEGTLRMSLKYVTTNLRTDVY